MIYTIYLDKIKIGISSLEKADAPMGVVCGKIINTENLLNFIFLSEYCINNDIIATKYPNDKLIITQFLFNLNVFNEKGVEIKGIGSYIEGMDSEGFEINILGIPYPFYEEEFPHHVKDYENLFE